MTEQQHDTAPLPAQDRPPATPAWVKALGVVLAVLVLLVLAKLAFGGGGLAGHGPGMHGG